MSFNSSGALPWDASSRFPWHVLNNPISQFQNMPSFFMGEILFLVITSLAFIHAFIKSNSVENRFIFVAALVAGTANDVFFMALPFVNNFWQAQALIMLTPRLPLYIPCVYICFMYYPTVAARAFVLDASRNKFDSVLARRLCLAFVTGAVSALYYWPYDIIGATFLWWTWHDTDAPIRERILGAPASSTLWTLTFVAAFAALLDWRFEQVLRPKSRITSTSSSLRSSPSASSASVARSNVLSVSSLLSILVPVACLSTPIMMIEMGILQLCESSGAPGIRSLFLGLIMFVAGATYLIATKHSKQNIHRATHPSSSGRWFFIASVALYSFGLIFIASVFAPEHHVSTGIHQKTGECGVMATDITGNVRELFLCVKNVNEPYTFECNNNNNNNNNSDRQILSPEKDDEWYTVCGKPHEDFKTWIIGVTWRSIATLALFIGFLI